MRLFIPLLLSVLCGGLDPARAESPAISFPRFSAEAQAIKVQAKSLQSGTLKIRLQEGVAVRIQDRGQAAGFFFKGRGQFEYMTRDRAEVAAMAHNLEKNLGIAPTKTRESVHFVEPFSELMMVSPELAGGLDGEATTWDAADPLASLLAPLQASVLARLEQLDVLNRSNGKGVPLRFELVKGSHGRFLHVVDPVETVTESLGLLRKSFLPHDVFDVIPLSELPLGWDRRVPVMPPATLTKVAMTVEALKGLGVKVVSRQTFRSNQDGVRALSLDLYNYKWDFIDDAPRARPYRLAKVLSSSGESLPFDHRAHSLLVMLPAPLSTGATCSLEFQMEGDLLIHPGGDNYWQLGVEPWFPTPPTFAGQDYTVEATIRVPKPYTIVAPGRTLGRRDQDGMNELTVAVEKPIQFFVVQAGKYRLHEVKNPGLTIRVATYADEAAEPDRLARLSQQIITFYQKFLGPFPFPEFNIIQMNQWGYGQAPPGTMFITNEAFRRLEDTVTVVGSEDGAIESFSLDRAFSKGVNGRFAHEIAHQYWGHVVKMPNDEEQWLTESFSEICAGLAVRQMKAFGPSFFESMATGWKKRGEFAAGASSIACANRLRSDGIGMGTDAALKRQALIYSKGAYLLDRIRRDIGDGPFMGFLGNYQATFAWKFGTTDHVVGLLKFMTKRDYRDLFERCYWDVEMPPEKLSAK